MFQLWIQLNISIYKWNWPMKLYNLYTRHVTFRKYSIIAANPQKCFSGTNRQNFRIFGFFSGTQIFLARAFQFTCINHYWYSETGNAYFENATKHFPGIVNLKETVFRLYTRPSPFAGRYLAICVWLVKYMCYIVIGLLTLHKWYPKAKCS